MRPRIIKIISRVPRRKRRVSRRPLVIRLNPESLAGIPVQTNPRFKSAGYYLARKRRKAAVSAGREVARFRKSGEKVMAEIRKRAAKLARKKKKSSPIKRKKVMATKTKSRKGRKHRPVKSRAGRLRARSTRGRKAHRITVYRYGKTKRTRKLIRPSRISLYPRKVNKRRRRRNPSFSVKALTSRYFGVSRLKNALMLIAGIGGAAYAKAMVVGIAGKSMRPWAEKLYGALAIVAGVTLIQKGKRQELKDVGTGMVAFGLYDLIVENVPSIGKFLPSISAPTFKGYDDMGAELSMGAEIPAIEAMESGVEAMGDDMADVFEMDA